MQPLRELFLLACPPGITLVEGRKEDGEKESLGKTAWGDFPWRASCFHGKWLPFRAVVTSREETPAETSPHSPPPPSSQGS